MEKVYPSAARIITPQKYGNEIAPIASVSKNFMGIATILFLSDLEKNSYLLVNRDSKTKGEKPLLEIEEVTIGQLLLNRKEKLEDVLSKSEDASLRNKLNEIDKWLAYAAENEIFRNTTIKSILNHTSKMGQLDLDTIGEEGRPHVIPATNFIRLLKEKEAFNGENSTDHEYNNGAFGLANMIMDLMTDEPTFFEETRKRVLEPIGVADSIMPYYEVITLSSPFEKREDFRGVFNRENFEGAFDFWNFNYSTTESAYTYVKADCSVAAGGLCATPIALEKYGRELVKFYNDQSEILNLGNGRKGSEVFQAFSVPTSQPKAGETPTHEEVYSLGLYRVTELAHPEHIIWRHQGGLPPHGAYLSVENVDGKPQEVIAGSFVNDAYWNVVKWAELKLIWNGNLHELYGEKLEKEEKKGFVKTLDAALAGFDKKPEAEKKYIADALRDILQIVSGRDGTRKVDSSLGEHAKKLELGRIAAEKKEKLTKKLGEIDSESYPVLKLFSDEIKRVAEVDRLKRSSSEAALPKKE